MIKYLEFKTNEYFKVIFKNVPEEFYKGITSKFSEDFFSESESSITCVLTVEFKSKLAERKNLSMVGRKFVFNSNDHYSVENNALAKIDFDKIFENDYILQVENEYDPVRFMGNTLEPLLKLILLKKGFISIHSSSCLIGEKMFVFPAWGNVGKTNLILAMQQNGAIIFGDDWTTITPDGKALIDIRPLNLLFYNFKLFPEFKKLISFKKKFFLKIDSFFRDDPSKPKKRSASRLRAYELILKLTETLSNTHIPLDKIQNNNLKEHVVTNLFLMMKYKEDSIKIEDDLDLSIVAQKCAVCFIYENRVFFDQLSEFNYASNNEDHLYIEKIKKLYIKVFIEVFTKSIKVSTASIFLPEKAERNKFQSFVKSLINSK
jgi:hypothetical protein